MHHENIINKFSKEYQKLELRGFSRSPKVATYFCGAGGRRRYQRTFWRESALQGDMAKSFSLQWVFEPFEREITFFTRPMFGGLAVYVHGRMVMVLMESPGDKSYRDQVFPFDIWNGVLLPTDRPYHASLKNEYASLVEHPVLGKWLYLPMLASTFEVDIEKIAKQIRHNDERYGVVPSMKKRQKKDAKKINKKKMRKKTTKKKVTRAKSKKVARKKVKRK